MSHFKYLEIRDALRKEPALGERPGKKDSILQYFFYIAYAFKLMGREKELITFTLFQWLSVLLGYYLFIQILFWIPEEVWRSTKDNHHGSVADIVLWLWLILCIGIASFPLSIFSSSMMVVHFLEYFENQPSNVQNCMRVVLPRVWRLWVFHWLDAYWTVMQIFSRLPKKNDRRTISQRVASEGLYYSWKIATMAILPNLVTGRGPKETFDNSIEFVKGNIGNLAKLRVGYSLCCWILGVATYILCILNYDWLQTHFFPGELEANSNIGKAYTIFGVPVMICAGVIQLFLRPAYMIGIADQYGGFLADKGEVVINDELPERRPGAFIACAILVMIVIAVFIFRDELGISAMLSVPYSDKP